MTQPFQPATPSDLPAFRVGHAQDKAAGTGCTVILAPEGAVCGVDVRGGGPATRETDLLKPENMIEAIHAVVLSGGSAFGLEASCGVMEELSQRGIGFTLGPACVPIVTGACLFDLLIGENAHPDKAMGRAAAIAAFERTNELEQGNIGAGCGATVGKFGAPERAMKSGLGWAGLRLGSVVVVALVAVNALGHVRNANGDWIAGELDDNDRVLDPIAAMLNAASALQADGAAASEAIAGGAIDLGSTSPEVVATNAATSDSAPDSASAPCTNTTIGCVLTNAKLTKAQATKASSVAHDAYARSIKPVHTSNDGDTIFTFASGEVEAPLDMVSMMATEAMQAAIENAVNNAEGAYGLKAAKDIASAKPKCS